MKPLGLMLLIVVAGASAPAGEDSWRYGEGRAFYRILSSAPTSIAWFDSMPNPDDPQEIWSSLIWTHASNPPPVSVVSIAFDLHGSWSTQNFWQHNPTGFEFSTNFVPTNAIQAFMKHTFDHVTDTNTQSATLVSDIPTDHVRGQVMVTAEDGVSDTEISALVDSYGHSIIERLFGEPATFLVAVPLNEEMTWAVTYETNAIVQSGVVNGIDRIAESRTGLSNKTNGR